MAFFIVSTMRGQEMTVADDVSNSHSQIVAVLSPDSLTNYVILEAANEAQAKDSISMIPGAKKVLPGAVELAEVREYLSPENDTEGLYVGDVVEVSTGAYAGEVARITTVNSGSETVEIELHDSPIPIPIEVPAKQVRHLEQDGKENE